VLDTAKLARLQARMGAEPRNEATSEW